MARRSKLSPAQIRASLLTICRECGYKIQPSELLYMDCGAGATAREWGQMEVNPFSFPPVNLRLTHRFPERRGNLPLVPDFPQKPFFNKGSERLGAQRPA